MCYFQSRGAISCLQLIAQRRGLHSFTDMIPGTLESHTCTMSISWWVVANPRTTLPSFQQTFSTIFDVTSLPARFSQSVVLGAIWLYWKGRVCFQSILFSTDYGDDSFHCFSGPFIDPFLSGETGVFLHARCMPQQNSQGLFWASVCRCFWRFQLTHIILASLLVLSQVGTASVTKAEQVWWQLRVLQGAKLGTLIEIGLHEILDVSSVAFFHVKETWKSLSSSSSRFQWLGFSTTSIS